MLDIEKLIQNLATVRPVFHSEADFQFALGWLIQQEYPQYSIRFEFKPRFNPSMHIDILVITDDQKWIPIELKYKTKKPKTMIEWNNEAFILTNHSAIDQNCYRYLKDIERIESVAREAEQYIEGYAIMLTNDAGYLKPCSESACYAEFSIHEGARKVGNLAWQNITNSGTTKRMEKPIDLKNEYLIHWKEYSQISDNMFYYTVASINRIPICSERL